MARFKLHCWLIVSAHVRHPPGAVVDLDEAAGDKLVGRGLASLASDPVGPPVAEVHAPQALPVASAVAAPLEPVAPEQPSETETAQGEDASSGAPKSRAERRAARRSALADVPGGDPQT